MHTIFRAFFTIIKFWKEIMGFNSVKFAVRVGQIHNYPK